jgi:hypothetical protein
VFILPSGGQLDLEYLDLLEGHVVVDHATLTEKSARAAAAAKIVDAAARVREGEPPARTSGNPRPPSESVPPSLRPGR